MFNETLVHLLNHSSIPLIHTGPTGAAAGGGRGDPQLGGLDVPLRGQLLPQGGSRLLPGTRCALQPAETQQGGHQLGRHVSRAASSGSGCLGYGVCVHARNEKVKFTSVKTKVGKKICCFLTRSYSLFGCSELPKFLL